jgi:hypothetical protein
MRVRAIDTAHLTPAKRWAVRACFCLLAITLVVQTLHLHPNELAQTDIKHCAICQVAHAPGQVAPIPHVDFGLTRVAFVAFLADPHPKPVLASFSLFCRPPPLV